MLLYRCPPTHRHRPPVRSAPLNKSSTHAKKGSLFCGTKTQGKITKKNKRGTFFFLSFFFFFTCSPLEWCNLLFACLMCNTGSHLSRRWHLKLIVNSTVLGVLTMTARARGEDPELAGWGRLHLARVLPCYTPGWWMVFVCVSLLRHFTSFSPSVFKRHYKWSKQQLLAASCSVSLYRYTAKRDSVSLSVNQNMSCLICEVFFILKEHFSVVTSPSWSQVIAQQSNQWFVSMVWQLLRKPELAPVL